MPGASAPEWMGFQEAEYKFFDHRATWPQAQRICSWFQASLASVHSEKEGVFLSTVLNKVAFGQHQSLESNWSMGVSHVLIFLLTEIRSPLYSLSLLSLLVAIQYSFPLSL
jgi:hypothetical protein